MASQPDVAKGREIVARWCNLAEQRVEYLTELFETGRWRRFYGQQAFLENVREAKGAVEAWQALLSREALPDNRAIDLSWLGRPRTALPPSVFRSDVAHRPKTLDAAAELRPKISDLPEVDSVGVGQIASAKALQLDAALVPDPTTIADRYPLLRNAL
jgi:uncharacterized repeat protein (TIGR03809 family)